MKLPRKFGGAAFLSLALFAAAHAACAKDAAAPAAQAAAPKAEFNPWDELLTDSTAAAPKAPASAAQLAAAPLPPKQAPSAPLPKITPPAAPKAPAGPSAQKPPAETAAQARTSPVTAQATVGSAPSENTEGDSGPAPEVILTARLKQALTMVKLAEENNAEGARARQAVTALTRLLNEPVVPAPSQAERAAALTLLGHAHALLGRAGESGDHTLQAADSYRDALKEIPPGDSPVLLRLQAAAKTGLGWTLLDVNARTPAPETAAEAMSSLEEAAEIYKHFDDKQEYGLALTALGSALRTSGEQRNDLALLAQSEDTFREAVAHLPAENVPFARASAQTGLGNAKRALGERTGDAKMLQASVDAHLDALKTLPPERGMEKRAMILNNLGAAQARLGELEKGTEMLWKAKASFEAALEERTRDRAPTAWAATSKNLSKTLAIIGEREKTSSYIMEAKRLLESTLEVYQVTQPSKAPEIKATLAQWDNRMQAIRAESDKALQGNEAPVPPAASNQPAPNLPEPAPRAG